ncbi:MAG TPA: hypothetical protein VGF72_05305 [Gaiellaceae bacterium]
MVWAEGCAVRSRAAEAGARSSACGVSLMRRIGLGQNADHPVVFAGLTLVVATASTVDVLLRDGQGLAVVQGETNRR